MANTSPEAGLLGCWIVISDSDRMIPRGAPLNSPNLTHHPAAVAEILGLGPQKIDLAARYWALFEILRALQSVRSAPPSGTL